MAGLSNFLKIKTRALLDQVRESFADTDLAA